MSNRYSAVALRAAREMDVETLVREVGGAGPDASLDPVDIRPFSQKAREGLISVISLASGWKVLWGGSILEWGWDDPNALAKAVQRATAGGGEAVFWFVEGVTDTIGFTVFENGRPVRNWVQSEGEVAENDGDPLPGEPDGLFGAEPNEDRDEWTIVTHVVEARVAPWEVIAHAPYATFRVGGRGSARRRPAASGGEGRETASGGGILGALRRWIFGG